MSKAKESEDCVFCKIINGDIPAQRVYKDYKVQAFLDIHPASEGHIVIVPNKHQKFLWDLDEDTYTYLLLKAREIALRLNMVLQPSRVGVAVDGELVTHAHIHLLPLEKDLAETLSSRDMAAEPDLKALEELAKKLRIR